MPFSPRIEIINQTKQRIGISKISAYLGAALRQVARSHRMQAQDAELIVIIVSRSEIRKLNKKYRFINRETDILSFESDFGLGELVICYDVVREYARKHRVRIQDEMTYVLLHGILHLLGYDHEDSIEEAEKMFRLQDHLYNRLAKRFGLNRVQEK